LPTRLSDRNVGGCVKAGARSATSLWRLIFFRACALIERWK
jgi:hypothetical protein